MRNFALARFNSESPIHLVRVYPRSEKLRLTEELARLDCAPVRWLIATRVWYGRFTD